MDDESDTDSSDDEADRGYGTGGSSLGGGMGAADCTVLASESSTAWSRRNVLSDSDVSGDEPADPPNS